MPAKVSPQARSPGHTFSMSRVLHRTRISQKGRMTTMMGRMRPSMALKSASGRPVANMVNEAALAAARPNRKAVLMYDFELAKDKVLMGAERKSLLLSDEEKKNTAYHEAGHALVAAMLPHSDPVHKVTIIPRGMALGLTMQLPT